MQESSTGSYCFGIRALHCAQYAETHQVRMNSKKRYYTACSYESDLAKQPHRY